MEISYLYQELIIDHGTEPRNFGCVDHPTHCAKGVNPLCGDKIDISIQVRDGIIEEIAFEGEGCAISTASASIMTEQLQGKKISEALDLFETFTTMVTTDDEDTQDLGKLQALSGVKQFPARVKCATLAWHAMQKALLSDGNVDNQQSDNVVTTE